MTKTFSKTIVCAIVVMAAVTGCKKPSDGAAGPAGATGPAGPSYKGNLQGVVFLYDAAGSKILSASTQAGDSVILTNNSSGAVQKTVTSSTGSYTFTNISTGTYSMVVTKPGYGTVWAQGVQFAGGGNANRNFSLSQIPTTTVTAATAVDTTITQSTGATPENYVKVRGAVPAAAGGSTVIVFVSVPSMSTVNNTPGNYSTYYTVNVSPGVLSYRVNIPTANLYDLGFVSGNTVNFAAYIIGGNTNASSYVDWITGQNIFTALSSAAVTTSALVQ